MKPPLAFLLLSGLAGLAACRPSNPAALMPPPLDGGRLVFEDDFEGSTIGEEWSAVGTPWSIQDGWLAVERAENDALWLQTPLPNDVRVEFEARSLSEVGDIKFEIFGDGTNHESGYIGIFGGWSNSINTVARLDEHGTDRLEGQVGVQVVPEQTYRMSIIRTDNRLRWFIDGEEFLVFDDAAPLTGTDHDHFAFNNWHVPLRFDNLRVYDLARDPG